MIITYEFKRVCGSALMFMPRRVRRHQLTDQELCPCDTPSRVCTSSSPREGQHPPRRFTRISTCGVYYKRSVFTHLVDQPIRLHIVGRSLIFWQDEFMNRRAHRKPFRPTADASLSPVMQLPHLRGSRRSNRQLRNAVDIVSFC